MTEASREPSGRRGGDLGVALGLALGPAVGLGFARFAYALLLPAMRADLGWSFSVAGAMNTANALGYLLGALLAASAARLAGSRRMFLAGLAITALALGLSAFSENNIVLLALRAVNGVAGAISFVVGAGLAAQAAGRHAPARAALLLGVYFAGGGAGSVGSGLLIPPLLAHSSDEAGWREGWLLLGALSVLALALSILAVRRAQEPPSTLSTHDRWPRRTLMALLVAYLLFGAGYISYMTFIVALLEEEGFNPGEITSFWIVLGIAAVAAPFAWSPILSRLPGGRGPALVLAVVTAGALLPLLSATTWAAFVSAGLFGGSFLTVVTAVTDVARVNLHPSYWTPAIGTLTVAFALGQCVGPAISGALSDRSSGVFAGLALSAGILASAMLTALAQRPRDASQDPHTPRGTR